MHISSFFRDLITAYQAEIDDLAFDSDGKNVLSKRLAEKRKELGFLVQMMELSPEMVAVVFHQGFSFKNPAALAKLVACEVDKLPPWASVANCLTLTPKTQELAAQILKEPMGEWFMTVAAALEFLYHRPAVPARSQAADEQDEDGAHDEEDTQDHRADADESSDDDGDERNLDEAGADWLSDQGFDRKE